MAESLIKKDLKCVTIRKSVTVAPNTRVDINLTDDIYANGITLNLLKTFDALIDYAGRYYDLKIDSKYKGAKCGFYISNVGSESVTNNLTIILFY
jgi:hypothetical protein